MHARVITLLFLAWMLVPSAVAEVIDLGFQRPTGTAFDSGNSLYVVQEVGQVKKVNPGPPPLLVATFGAPGSGDGELSSPQDITIDVNAKVVIADYGNQRLALFTSAGAFSNNLACARAPMRVASAGNYLFALEVAGPNQFQVEKFDAANGYALVSTFDVSGTCGVTRSSPSVTAVMSIDANANLWIAERIGCGDQYQLRKYSSTGSLLGSWSRTAEQLSPDTLAASGYTAGLITDVFASGSNVYVILGVGGSETGGVDVDVWSTSGDYVRRSSMTGPGRPHLKGTVRGTKVYVADTKGTQNVLVYNVSSF